MLHHPGQHHADRRVDTLPANYAATYGTNTWWRIRYTFGSSVSDRTTWGVSVAGAPVRLTDS